MGWTVGIPSLKLNNAGTKSKHCGNFQSVAAEALKERQGHDPDINPELASKNRYIGFSTAAELVAYSSGRVAQLRDAKGRAVRRDAVVMCVTIFKPPAALMASLSEEQRGRLLGDGVEKIRQIVGEKNVKAEAWHFDEQGDHVHVFWEPMTEDGRLCARERHNLQFLNRLNREIPEYLRARGWDIENCNAYDAAMDEMEKAQRRKRNGRSSAVYKADAERQLQYIDAKIQQYYATVEEQARTFGDFARENVAFDSSNVYDNVIYLISECDDARFEELDREGRELKRKHLGEALAETDIPKALDDIIKNAATLSWQERQRFWEDYRIQSDSFWELRSFLMKQYGKKMAEVYSRNRDVLWEYHRTLYCMETTRSLFIFLIFTIKAFFLELRESFIEEDIARLRREREDLIRDTASFKKFSKRYAEELKAGLVPTKKYMNTMEGIVHYMDKKAREHERRSMACDKEWSK